jgi:hypothetical protein
MALLAAVEFIWAVLYYYMAKTEMFFSPITQAFTYMFLRPFAGDSARQAEDLVYKLAGVAQKPDANLINKDYWNFNFILEPAQIAKVGEPHAKELITQLATVCQQPTPMDWLFKCIPTFTFDYHTQYAGMIDFMVNNRWCFDYVTFMARMYPQSTDLAIKAASGDPYPLVVPSLDWFWMIGAAVALVACILTMVTGGGGAPTVAATETPAQPVGAAQGS